MKTPVFEAPDNLDEACGQLDVLWGFIGRMQEAQREMQDARQVSLTEIALLEEKIRLLLHKRFGSSSEVAASPNQLRLVFDEAEQLQAESVNESVTDAHDSTETLTYSRKKPGRKAIPDDLPRLVITHELPEAERWCGCGGERHVIGEVISEQLDIIPAQVRVIRHARKKYACRRCEDGIKTAPLPPQPLPKSKASPGLLAFLITAKFADALPLYRQSVIFKRYGVNLPRQTLANWVIGCSTLVQPLLNLLQDTVLSGDALNMDETTVQVLKEVGRTAQHKSYMWVRVGGKAQQRVVLFHYAPSRGGEVARELLEGYQGYLQTDDYAAYHRSGQQPGVIHQGCMAHARRKFVDAQKAAKSGLSAKNKPKAGKTEVALGYFSQLYALEKRIKHLPDEARYEYRQKEALPILEAFRAWLDDALLSRVLPKGLLGKALSYLDKNWPGLTRYTEAGYLLIDNNAAENAIRPFVIGRKNWLFSYSPAGAQSSAVLYSLIETAKANQLEPYHYLKRVFTELPAARTLEQVEALLPWNMQTAGERECGV